MDERRAVIAGSAPQHDGNVQRSVAPPDQELTASIILRRKPERADSDDLLLSGQSKQISREDALQQMSADPRDIARVEDFGRNYGLRVVEADAGKRVVKVSGPIAAFDRAFGIQLVMFGNSISYEGSITVPEALAGVVIAVLGLDNRPIARTRVAGSYQ